MIHEIYLYNIQKMYEIFLAKKHVYGFTQLLNTKIIVIKKKNKKPI